MKGIILAGGKATRLHPITIVTSKQLLPVYDKPLYYPLSVLMLAEIREVLIICNSKDLTSFKLLFGNGDKIGMNIQYAVQEKPNGIAEAFIIGEDFIKNENVCLILGDNIFYGSNLKKRMTSAINRDKKATAFAYHVNNPKEFGVVEFDKNNRAISIEEKPKKPKSNFAITGLYFYDNKVVKIAKSIKPSKRGELEITDINKVYLKKDDLIIEDLGRGYAWLDTGSAKNLTDASSFVQTIEKRTGLKIGCIEEIAFLNKWINKKDVINIGNSMANTDYGKYLIDLCLV